MGQPHNNIQSISLTGYVSLNEILLPANNVFEADVEEVTLVGNVITIRDLILGIK